MSKNIKLGTTTYNNVDIVKLRDADQDDVYINYNEEGLPKSIASTAEYVPTPEDTGKFFVDSDNKMYRMKHVEDEKEFLKSNFPMPHYFAVSDSTPVNSTLQVIQMSSTNYCGFFPEQHNSTKIYKFTTNGGRDWQDYYQIEGISDYTERRYVFQPDSYGTSRGMIKCGDLLVVYSGAFDLWDSEYEFIKSTLYVSNDGQNFSKIDLSDRMPIEDGRVILGSIGTSIFIGASYCSGYSHTEYTIYEYNFETSELSLHTIEMEEHDSIDNVVFSQNKFYFLFRKENPETYERTSLLKSTSDFIQFDSKILSDGQDSVYYRMVPAQSISNDCVIAVVKETYDYESRHQIDIYNESLNVVESFTTRTDSYSYQMECSNWNNLIVGNNYYFAQISMPSSSYSGFCIGYFPKQHTEDAYWSPLVGGCDPEYPEENGISASSLLIENDEISFLQVWASEYSSEEESKRKCGKFVHKEYFLQELQYC